MKFLLDIDEGVVDIGFTLECTIPDLDDMGVDPDFAYRVIEGAIAEINRDAGYAPLRVRPAAPTPADPVAATLAAAVAAAAATATPHQLCAALAALGYPVAPPAPAPAAPPADPLAAARALCR